MPWGSAVHGGVSGEEYKYSVKLVTSGSGQAPKPLDPFILHHPD